MTTYREDFTGQAGAYDDARYMTDGGVATTNKLRGFTGSFGRLKAGGGVTIANDPQSSFIYVTTAKQDGTNGTASVTGFLNGTGAISVWIATSTLTGRGYGFEFGEVGFGGVTARLLSSDGPSLMNVVSGTTPSTGKGNPNAGQGSDDRWSSANNKSNLIDITVDTLTSGPNAGKDHIVARVKTDTGAYQVAFDEIVSPSDQAATGGHPGFRAVTNSGIDITAFSATINPYTGATPTGAVASILTIGDSNNQRRGAGTLSGVPIPQAVGEAVKAFGYGRVHVFNEAQSGTTSEMWAKGTDKGNPYINPNMLAHAAAVSQFEKVRVWNIVLGTNDSKDSVATSQANYKAYIITIITQGVAAGVVRFNLFDVPPIDASVSDFTGSAARVANYATANTQIAASPPAGAIVTRFPDISTLIAPHNTDAGWVSSDLIHYASATTGAPAARDAYVTAVKPSVQAQYSIAAGFPLIVNSTLNAGVLGTRSLAVIPNNDTGINTQVSVLVRVGTAGDVVCLDDSGATCFFKNVPAGQPIPILTRQVLVSGTYNGQAVSTTAADFTAIY